MRGFALHAVDTGSPGRLDELYRFPGDHTPNYYYHNMAWAC